MDMSASKPEPDDDEGDTEVVVLENIQTVDRHYELFLSRYIEYACLSCLPSPSTSAMSSASDPLRQKDQFLMFLLLSSLHVKTRWKRGLWWPISISWRGNHHVIQVINLSAVYVRVSSFGNLVTVGQEPWESFLRLHHHLSSHRVEHRGTNLEGSTRPTLTQVEGECYLIEDS